MKNSNLNPLFQEILTTMCGEFPKTEQAKYEAARQKSLSLEVGHVFNMPDSPFQAQNSTVYGHIVCWYEPTSIVPDGQINLGEGDFIYYKYV